MARLRQYADFTPAQPNEIVSAALGNNQVYRIAGDEDVRAFLSAVIEGHENVIEPDRLAKLKELLGAQQSPANNVPL